MSCLQAEETGKPITWLSLSSEDFRTKEANDIPSIRGYWCESWDPKLGEPGI
jgi:hypothetical protein